MCKIVFVHFSTSLIYEIPGLCNSAVHVIFFYSNGKKTSINTHLGVVVQALHLTLT